MSNESIERTCASCGGRYQPLLVEVLNAAGKPELNCSDCAKGKARPARNHDDVERFRQSSSGTLWTHREGEYVRYSDHERDIAIVKAESDERHDLLSKERRANDNLRQQLSIADKTIEGLAKRRDELLAQAIDHQRIVKELEAALLERAITAHNVSRHGDAWADCKMAACVDVRALLRKVNDE